jgi:hypothetical protein
MKALDDFLAENPGFSVFVLWLKEHGRDVSQTIEQSLAKLREKRKYLPLPAVDRYKRAIILNEFMLVWLTEQRRGGVESDDLFKTAIALAADDAALTKLLSSMVPARTRKAHAPLDAFAFEGFIAENVEEFSKKMISGFDPERPERAPLRYLRRMAARQFLRRAANLAATSEPEGLFAYLKENGRLKERARLAIKLAFLPAALGANEREILRSKYGWTVPIDGRHRVKDVAAQLGLSAAGLYTKIYKVRKWVKAWGRRKSRAIEKAAGVIDDSESRDSADLF